MNSYSPLWSIYRVMKVNHCIVSDLTALTRKSFDTIRSLLLHPEDKTGVVHHTIMLTRVTTERKSIILNRRRIPDWMNTVNKQQVTISTDKGSKIIDEELLGSITKAAIHI